MPRSWRGAVALEDGLGELIHRHRIERAAVVAGDHVEVGEGEPVLRALLAFEPHPD